MPTAVEKQLEKAKATLARVRNRTDERAAKLQRLGVAVGAAYLAGAYERNARNSGHAPQSIGGLDYRLAIAAAAYIGGEMIGGKTGEVLEDAGIGVLAAYAHREGQGRLANGTTEADQLAVAQSATLGAAQLGTASAHAAR